MPRNYLVWGALFGCVLGGAACYPGEIDTAAQTDLVVTFHADGADFQANATFDIPDTIIDIGVAAGGASTLDHAYDDQIVAKVVQQLTNMGYTRVDATSVQPDMVVVLSAITVE